MAEFTPRVYGKYYLLDRIAVGGMAEVYAARTYSTGGFAKTLAIKRILAKHSSNPAFVAMFISEARISVALQHANIVQTYDFGKIKENYFLAMEWVDGRDLKRLAKVLRQHKERLPLEFAVYIALEACKGLEYAHKLRDFKGQPLNIVHQDVSPSNLVISFDGDVKLVDFGIAKAEAITQDQPSDFNWGKVHYSAPERLRKRPPTPASDLFSLGVVLHEMLTGRRLFRGKSPKDTARLILQGDIEPPSRWNHHIPPQLDEVVMRALALKPRARFTDAAEMGERLFEFLDTRNPQLIKRSLGLYMRELFRDERRVQRDRLERSSQVAQEFQGSVGEVYQEGYTGEVEVGASGTMPMSDELMDMVGSEDSLPELPTGDNGGTQELTVTAQEGLGPPTWLPWAAVGVALVALGVVVLVLMQQGMLGS